MSGLICDLLVATIVGVFYQQLKTATLFLQRGGLTRAASRPGENRLIKIWSFFALFLSKA